MTTKSCSSATASSGWVGEAGAVFWKDLRAELRSRYALNAMAIFAVTTLVVVSFSLGPQALPPPAVAALLWVVLFFAAIASLSRVFLREEEAHTGRAAPGGRAGARYLGRLFNLGCWRWTLLVPLFLALMQACPELVAACSCSSSPEWVWLARRRSWRPDR